MRKQAASKVVAILVVAEHFRQGSGVLSLSSGSGTLVSAEGHVLTNSHVTDNGRSFRVVLADGREFPADRIGEDPISDLAVLKIRSPGTEFGFARFEPAPRLEIGDPVIAMGAPWGLANSVSSGTVNNPARLLVSLFQDEADYEEGFNFDQPTGRFYAWIQHDAPISPGNSGGPLVDAQGRFIGVNTRGSFFGGDMAFAIPSDEALRVMRSLIAHGTVLRTDFGFRVRSLKGSGAKRGVLVTAVDLGSAADQAGLRPGDQLLSINAEAVQARRPVEVPAVQRRLAEWPSEKVAEFTVLRDQTEMRLRFAGEALPATLPEEYELTRLGITVRALTPTMARRRGLAETPGWLVTGVRPGAAAALAKPALLVGDVLRRIHEQVVPAPNEWQEPAVDKLKLQIERRASELLVVLSPADPDRARPPNRALRKPWAGAEVQAITRSTAEVLGLPGPGYRISYLYPGGPLQVAGFEQGDLLQSLDDRPLLPLHEDDDRVFHSRIRDGLLGEQMQVVAWRPGAEQIRAALSLQVGPAEADALPGAEVDRLGVTVREISVRDVAERRLPSAAKGVLIERVEPGGLAALAHLRAGDVLHAVNDQDIVDLRSFHRAWAAALSADSASLRFAVQRQAARRLLLLDRSWME
nr:trypsin-like peptidase domain-containing protein [Pseudomarimonas arenosa]